ASVAGGAFAAPSLPALSRALSETAWRPMSNVETARDYSRPRTRSRGLPHAVRGGRPRLAQVGIGRAGGALPRRLGLVDALDRDRSGPAPPVRAVGPGPSGSWR